MEALTIVIIVLAFGYLAFVVLERIYVDLLRKKFKLVVHVNGIRGKSTTTRLIEAGLRNCGYKVFSKTTGTIPTMINVNNEMIPIKRWGPANIREQILMMRKAAKQGADALVLECMAVNPNLQRICEEKILRADICVITNVRLDHLQDMGNNLDELAAALSLTTPTNGTLIVNPSEFIEYFKQKASMKNSKFIVAEEFQEENVYDTFPDNVALALETAKSLNLNLEDFKEGMKAYRHDVGSYQAYRIGDMVFLNGFSINDPTSIKMVYNLILATYDSKDISILLNSRYDRPTRVMQHMEMLQSMPCKKLIIMGSNINYEMKRVKKQYPNYPIEKYVDIEKLKDEKVVFAIGNIAGNGMKMLNYFKENGEKV